MKEIQKMLELTPLEQTVAGKELIQIGEEEGIKKGIKKGREKARKETAANLLKMGMDMKTISRATGMGEEEIIRLASKIRKSEQQD